MKNILRYACLLLLCGSFIFTASAQNLVVDPGFESATSCTDNFNATPGWDDGGGGGPADTCATPDIFTPCGSLITAIFGSHVPHSGNNYAGAYLGVTGGFGCLGGLSGNGREYVQGSLSSPLVAGQKYCVKFYVALSKSSPMAFAKLGVYFSNTKVVHNYCPGNTSAGTLLPLTPQLVWCGPVIKDTVNWTEVKWIYTATGGEQYFTVGNFNNDATTGAVCANGSAFFPMMYYFYDDFSVTSGCCPDSLVFSGISTPGCGVGSGTSSATATTASATCSAAGTNVTFSYLWSNGATTQNVSNVTPGNYTVTVSNSAGCSSTGSINLSSANPINMSVSPTAAVCGSSNGSATASITSGTGPFTYAWSDGETTQTISSLASGSYTVTVTSTGGCSATASATVGTSGNISLTPTVVATTCNASNGQAGVTASGGSGTYTYAWSNGGSTATITNLASGNYSVTVTEAGCSATSSASVAASSPLALHEPVVTASTCGNSNGGVSVSVNVGTGPYTYAWSNGSTQQAITGLGAGTYTVTVTGAGGCSATASGLISPSSAVSITTTGGGTSCSGAGSASVNVTAGTGPFAYAWSNGTTAASLSGVAAGNYSVTVTGAANCSASATVTVSNTGNGVVFSTSPIPTNCASDVGGVNVSVTSGTAPYTYAWSNGATTDSIRNLAGGSYSVTVTGNNGCSTTGDATVSVSGTLLVNTSVVNTTCGNANGSASVTSTGGSYTYVWSNGATTATISNLAAGTYTVTVNGLSGCNATSSVVINPSGGAITIQPSATAICQGDTSQICAPAGYQSYRWNVGDTGRCVDAVAPGNYYVTVTDNASCTAISNHVAITVNTANPVTISEHGDTLFATGASAYQWYFGNAVITGATASVYVATQSGNYTVKATDVNGCIATSNTENVKVTPLGIGQVSTDNYIKVYPNPLREGGWHIEVSTEWLGSNCEIYDAAGRQVYHTELKNSQTEINLNVSQGIYLMRVNTELQNYTIKLIKL